MTGLGLLLVSCLEVDLARVSSATCPGITPAN
jgi:hypothetical protein